MSVRFLQKICLLILMSFAFLIAQVSTLAQSSQEFVHAVAWSPDGNLIAYSQGDEICSDNDRTISVVNATTGMLVRILPAARCRITELDWSPDGSQLSASMIDSEGLMVWNVSSAEVIAVGLLGGQGYGSVRWHPNGNELMVTAPSNGIGIFDAITGEYLYSPPLNGTRADWSPDGERIVSGSGYENDVWVGDAERLIMTLSGHRGSVFRVDWSPDGQKLASISTDNTLRIWNADTGDPLEVFDLEGVGDIQWNPDSTLLAVVMDESIQILDAATGQTIVTFPHEGRVYSLDWSPDGTQLVYAGSVQTDDEPITIVSIDLLEATETASPQG